MRRGPVLALVLAGCGRLGFDESTVTPPPPDTVDPFGALLLGCEVRLEMEELDWASEPVRDTCGSPQDGTAGGGAVAVLDGERGRVGELVGGASCIQIPDAPELRGGNAFTIAAWVRPAELAPNSFGIVSKRVDFMTDAAYSLFVWDNGTGENRLYIDVDTENERFELPTDNFLGAWRHVAVAYDGARPEAQRIRLFVDGMFRSFAPESSSAIPVPAVPPAVSIGCLPLGTPAQGLAGRIDDVVYWSRALDDTELAAWYTATR